MRISAAGLRRMRQDRSGRILVTGATGFLGSHIAAALLGHGYRVSILARPAKGVTARERVARLAAWLGLDGGAAAALEIVEGDILAPDGAAAALDGGGGAGRIDEIVHCASSTAFAERKRAEVEAANIDGLGRVLDLAVRSGCGFFHHISTAYAAGKRTGLCAEDWVEAGPFTNVYEETKARGEVLARDVCRREGIRLNVYRPAIVYGDSRTGRTLRFNALYFPVKAAVFLRDIYLEDIRERGGRKAAELGIRLTDDGALFLPLRIEAGDEGGIDLVPVDHCVGAFLAIFEDGLDGGIYHIVNRRPTRIDDLVAFTRRRFRLEGLETCGPGAFAAHPRTALERLYGSYLEPYQPYMGDARSFDDARAAEILERRGLACPEFDYGLFARCMDYAVETDWGARLFPR
jgi:nucleoside-diphosphate-sugar epimerase